MIKPFTVFASNHERLLTDAILELLTILPRATYFQTTRTEAFTSFRRAYIAIYNDNKLPLGLYSLDMSYNPSEENEDLFEGYVRLHELMSVTN